MNKSVELVTLVRRSLVLKFYPCYFICLVKALIQLLAHRTTTLAVFKVNKKDEMEDNILGLPHSHESENIAVFGCSLRLQFSPIFDN